jgi:dCMP deaminase
VSQESWDQYLLAGAHWAATKSKDPSTKVGALIARPDHSVASTGFNGFPRGIEDTPERLNNRDVKYSLILHAESNALDTAREDLTGYTLYCTFMPCDRCFVRIIQAGIKRVVFPRPTPEQETRWGEAFKRVICLAVEANITMTQYEVFQP